MTPYIIGAGLGLATFAVLHWLCNSWDAEIDRQFRRDWVMLNNKPEATQ